MNEHAMEVWAAAWPPETHTTEYALKRIESAKSPKLTPIKIDSTDLYGYFQGSHGRYETFLDICPCGDFRRSKKPCKHIYRLAMELGVMEGSPVSDPTYIVVPKEEKMSLDDEIDIVEKLPVPAQKVLLSLASSHSLGNRVINKIDSEELHQAIETGMVQRYPDGKKGLIFGKKSELVNDLKSMGLDYDKKMKIAELQEFCIDNYFDQLSEKYTVTVPVVFSPYVTPRHLHLYLDRKFSSEAFYKDGKPIPEEWQYVITKFFPDDNITEQLIRFGYCEPENVLRSFTITISV